MLTIRHFPAMNVWHYWLIKIQHCPSKFETLFLALQYYLNICYTCTSCSDVETASHAGLLSNKSSECLVNWNWTVYKVYGEQDKSDQNVQQLAQCFYTPVYIYFIHHKFFYSNYTYRCRKNAMERRGAKKQVEFSFEICLIANLDMIGKCVLYVL